MVEHNSGLRSKMPKNVPKVSIVVTAYKNIEKLRRCLRSICDDSYENKEVILISYGMDPQELENDLKSCIAKHVVLKNDKGYVYQKNIGFKNIDRDSKYVMFIDDDVEINPNTIRTLVSILEKFKDIGLAQPLLITEDYKIDSIGAYLDYLGYSYMPLRGKELNEVKLRKVLYRVSYVASCVILRTELFRNQPFLPYESFYFFNYEDVDLALRTWLRGYKVVSVPFALAIHKRGRTSLLKNVTFKFAYLNARNRLTTLLSLYDLSLIFKYIPLLVLFEIIKAIILLGRKPSHGIAIFYAIIWVIKNLKYIVKRRYALNFSILKRRILNNILIKPHFSTLIREFRRHYG